MFYTYSKDVRLILLEFTFTIFLPFLWQIFRNSRGRDEEKGKNTFSWHFSSLLCKISTLTGHKKKEKLTERSYQSLKSRRSQTSDIPKCTHHKWKSHITITISILFPNFTNCFNEKLIFYHYNRWAHDTAIKHWVLHWFKKKQLKEQLKKLSTATQVFQSHNLLYIEKAALNITPFCKSLAEQWQKKKNSSHEMSSIDVKPPQKIRVSLHFRAPKLSQSVAEQARLAWARLFTNGNKVRTVYWIYLGGFIYVSVCWNECLQNSINSSKQTYLQTEEQPPLCAGFGFLETRMEKNKKGEEINYLQAYQIQIRDHTTRADTRNPQLPQNIP